MSLLIIVPARGGSKRLPGKNIRPLAGLSLLERTAEAIAASGLMADVVLTTDDEAIAGVGRALNWLVPFRRPTELATDNATMSDTILNALDWFARDRGHDPDQILLLQPTSPFRNGECLAQAVNLLQSMPEANSVIGMTRLKVGVSHVYALERSGLVHPIDAASDRAAYVPNGTLYLVRTKAFREAGTLFALPMLPLPIDSLQAVDIDEPSDWALAEALIAADLVQTARGTRQ
jgi:CMP-N-acetylneuraminic acid synthetase